ncbi:MAG: toxin-antitoxin system HicB family antitoxin [Deltaproteobacteria bacterium]|nr:toxin-antitoxin system HicB family antitoxin [Deltaproteobacteria bacterium]
MDAGKWEPTPEAIPRAEESTAISLRVPKRMLTILKEFARREGVGYQVLMKRWLDDRIRAEAKRAGIDVLRGSEPMQDDLYTYRVTWSDEDRGFLGLCAEFPSLSWLAPSHEEALKGVRGVVAGVVAGLRAKGEKVPEPFAARRFTGKLEVRVSEDVHRRLAIEATEEGVSLDGLVASKLGA